ncbi:Crp/Fnr family transcriptional regulator [Sphingomonas jatrophae]|uniref:Transcriptional regulator, Crp/Fnr family n=1 Tax=Sphingomonas jatrophae TaxID=1166337 RepID=A0A1I6LIS4_9SPHN|nr:Crp/Fnr family transcriptional regulator [Sphingomonas jatrophae]SFS03258.1 transcriptional regulator, Crp/Fnr family [Sphingomonas jatrophae]
MTAPVCSDCAVRDRALCGALDDVQLGALNRLGRRRRLAAGERFAWAGDESDVCANLLSGILTLTTSSLGGEEQIVGLLYPADFVGRPWATRADFTVTALAPAELCVFPREGFERVLAEHPAMERLLLERTLAALTEARGRMLTLARGSAEARIAGFLLDIAARAGGCSGAPGLPVTFDLPLDRAGIARLLGLTIETVSRRLTRFERDGLVRLPARRAVTILDPDALARLAAG